MIKVERSQPAPESLAIEAQKKDGVYNKPDVIARLRQDFHKKCYICGTAELQDGVPEHRLPHKNGLYLNRKFDWNNLFWSCRHCNGVKNTGKYDNGIIDCCARDPEKLLKFEFLDGNVAVSSLAPKDAEANLTAELVYEVFNRTNTGMRIGECEDRIKWLSQEMNGFITELRRYRKHSDSKYYQRMMRAYLQRESAFAEFKLAYVRKRLGEFPGLREYLV